MSRLPLIALTTVLVHLGLLVVMPDDGAWVERIYAQGIYPSIGPLIAWSSSLLPFSVAGMVVVAVALWIPVQLAVCVNAWRRSRLTLTQAASRCLAAYVVAAAIVLHSFFLFWGYNYLRPPLEQRLGFGEYGLTSDQEQAAARQIVTAAVAARVDFSTWNLTELDRLIDRAISDAINELEGRPTPVASRLKGDFGTGLLAKVGTRGVVSPWTLEAHVDFDLPPFLLPFTAAHEKAHLAGFARERDANFVAWYALTRSDDPRLRYAGYFGVVPFFLNGQTRALAAPLEADLAASRDYSRRRVSASLQQASMRTYNVYLRANRVESGLDDYRQVSDLIAAWLNAGRR